jgi:hypothetical protein
MNEVRGQVCFLENYLFGYNSNETNRKVNNAKVDEHGQNNNVYIVPYTFVCHMSLTVDILQK